MSRAVSACRGPLFPVLLALSLAACAERPVDPLAPPDGAAAAGAPLVLPGDLAAAAPAAPAPGSAAASVPHFYIALQEDPAGPTSVILAIDRSRDGTPSDDPAIRITPDAGACNPQQLRYYTFPPGEAERPTYGPQEAARGVTARDLPDFLATAVTSEMLLRNMAAHPDDTQPQNICTRKLLQRIILDRSATTG